MCKQRRSTIVKLDNGDVIRPDKCMTYPIYFLNKKGIKTLGCCCGHGRYPTTIIVNDNGKIKDMISGIEIARETRFYKKDKKGFFYIPEISKEKKC